MTGAHASTADPKPEELTHAVEAFLADHGDLCLAMYSWPRDVTPEDRQAGSHEAVQLPVLERLGVVRSEDLSGTKRYFLTAKGRESFLQKRRTTLDVHGQVEQHDGDFCVAHLTLDKVIKRSPTEQIHGRVETVASYTYKVRSAAWMADPQARKVFPMVDRIIRGEHNALMTATLQVQNGKWVPVLPGQ